MGKGLEYPSLCHWSISSIVVESFRDIEQVIIIDAWDVSGVDIKVIVIVCLDDVAFAVVRQHGTSPGIRCGFPEIKAHYVDYLFVSEFEIFFYGQPYNLAIWELVYQYKQTSDTKLNEIQTNNTLLAKYFV